MVFFVSKIKHLKCDEAIGVKLCKVSLIDRQSANKFVENGELKALKMRTFIPRNFTETYEVIRNILGPLRLKNIM